MILLQFSCAQGPDECSLAVSKALQRFCLEAESFRVDVEILEQEENLRFGTLRSALVAISGERSASLSEKWCGTLQWICTSPYRKNHGRKNWFIGVAPFTPTTMVPESEIRFEALRASGPGGQHVNKTDSAVRATHIASGISVKVQTERSQHANKRLALLLIGRRLEQLHMEQQVALKAQRRQFHHQISRGDPVRIFKGMKFEPL